MVLFIEPNSVTVGVLKLSTCHLKKKIEMPLEFRMELI